MNAPLCNMSNRLTVMEVDDEDTFLSLIVELLQDRGYIPVPGTRDDSALALLEQAPQLALFPNARYERS